MKTISTEELKAKLDRGDDFKLLMAFDGWRFESGHIPGSLSAGSPASAMAVVSPDDCIVVYCTSADCSASQILYRALERAGYTHLVRYPGGVHEWAAAGHPLAGERVRSAARVDRS